LRVRTGSASTSALNPSCRKSRFGSLFCLPTAGVCPRYGISTELSARSRGSHYRGYCVGRGATLDYRRPDDEERQRMIERGESAEIVAAHLSIYRAIREGRLATVTDTVEYVLGRKPIRFDQWVDENATAFGNSAHAS
jgi:hypothetical protein